MRQAEVLAPIYIA